MKLKLKDGYIDRTELLKMLYPLALEKADGKCKVSHIISRVELMSAADVAPVKHGIWRREIDKLPKCSACGHETTYPLVPYCSQCGARMGGEGQ